MTGRECDLCGLGCGKHALRQQVADRDRFFCCLGCLNVYLILWESGAITAGADIRQTELFRRSLELGLISRRSDESTRNVPQEPTDSTVQELLLHVTGMWCSSCAWLIEHALASIPGMVSAEASFASDLVKVRYHPQALPPEHIIRRIQSLGYKAHEDAGEGDSADAEKRDLLIRTGVAAFFWANIMSFSLALYVGYFEWISGSVRRGLPFLLMGMATPVVFYCAWPILRLAWQGLRNRTIRMEALLGLGILAAYGFSVVQVFRGETHVYFDTATVIVTIVLAGKLIERGAKERAARWITRLHGMAPNKVRLLANGSERFVSVDALEPGEIFVVKAGERIPADGLVLQGESYADESLLTGESFPVGKQAGSSVAAGSVNVDGVLQVQATKTAGESTLSRIIALVEHALSSRSPMERAVDRVSRIFVPGVVLAAVLTFFFTWFAGAGGLGQALMRGITVLVIACPCALGMATPLAIAAAMGSASRLGILVSDSRVLETLHKVDTVILDKTGTVTEGKFSLLDFALCELPCTEAVLAAGVSVIGDNTRLLRGLPTAFDSDAAQSEALTLFASLEQFAEHPLGKAVVEFAGGRGIKSRTPSSVEIHKGRGITGEVEGHQVFAGNRRIAAELGIPIRDGLEQQAMEWESEGRTVAFFGWDGAVRAAAAFGDRLNKDAVALAEELKSRRIKVHLVSGDSQATTQWVASRLGCDHYRAEVLPEEKAEAIRQLQAKGAVVAMVGDGINDAPALAQADLGIAMGSGTDLAMKAAAVVLMNGSLERIVDILDLSQKTLRVVRQNLFWAFLYNSLGISLAVAGVLTPIMAAVAMLVSSVSVVANSMRLTRQPVQNAFR